MQVKKRISMFIAIAMAFYSVASPVSAYAAGPHQWGDTPGRTHVSNLNDGGGYWNTSGLISGVSGIGTPEGDPSNSGDSSAGMLYVPNSAPNPSSNGTLYGYETKGPWVKNANGSMQPQRVWSQAIFGIQNSSPVAWNGNVYVAGSEQLYGFQGASGGAITTAHVGSNNNNNIFIPGANNVVLSHPLADPNTGAIWVSSHNSYLFAISPTTLGQLGKVKLAGGTDSSPSIVQASGTTTKYVAVGISNYGGQAGEVEIISDTPNNPQVLATYQDPNHQSIVGAVIDTGQGNLMWSDISGTVYHANLVYNPVTTIPSITNVTSTHGPSGTFTNEEGAYVHGTYIIPDTNSANIELVNGSTMQMTVVHSKSGANNSGTPEIGSTTVFVPASDGSLTEIPVGVLGGSASYIQGQESSVTVGGTAGNLASTNMTTLGNQFGSSSTTMTFITSKGLALFQNLPFPTLKMTVQDNATGQQMSAISYTSGQFPKFPTLQLPAGTAVNVNIQVLNAPAPRDTISLSSPSVPLTYGPNLQETYGQLPTSSPFVQQGILVNPETTNTVGFAPSTPMGTFSLSAINGGTAPISITSQSAQTELLSAQVAVKGYSTLLAGIKVQWTPVSPPSLSLSVAPTTSQKTGQTFQLTAKTANANGDHVVFTQSGSLSNNGGSGTLSGNFQSNVSSIAYPKQSTSSYQYQPTATSSGAGSETVTAALLNASNQPVTNASGQAITASAPMTWTAPAANPSITLAVSPTTSQPVNKSFALTATAQNIKSGEVVQIAQTANTSPGTLIGSTYVQWTAGNYASYAFHTTATSSTAQTVSYQASIYTLNGQLVPSNTVSATWTAVAAPTITISANPTSLATGRASQITVNTTNLQAGDQVVIAQTDQSAAGTLAGNFQSGQTSITYKMSHAYSTYTFSPTATSQSALTYKYTAQIRSSSGQALVSAGPVAVIWASSSSPPPVTTATLTLSAQYTSLSSTGAGDSLLATGSGLSSGATIMITQTNTSGGDTFGSQGQANSSGQYYVEANTPALGPVTINDVSGASPYTANYSAQAVNPSNGQVEATSSAVDVTWQNPPKSVFTGPVNMVVTVTPPSQQVGNLVTGTVTASDVPYGYTVQVWAQPPLPTGGYQPWWSTNSNYQLDPMQVFSAVQKSTKGTFSGTFSTTEQVASTTPYLYQGLLVVPNSPNAPPGNVDYYAPPAYVTWTAPPFSMSLSPHAQTLLTGQTATFGLNYQQLPPGYSIAIVNVTNSIPMYQPAIFSGPSSSPPLYSSGLQEFTISKNQPTSMSFVAVEYRTGNLDFSTPMVGNQVIAISNTISITWANPSVSLSANPTSLPAGRASTLTATGLGVPTGDYVQIYVSGYDYYTNANANYTAALATLSSTPNSVTGVPNSGFALPFTVSAISNTPQWVQYEAAIMEPNQFLYYNSSGQAVYGPVAIATSVKRISSHSETGVVQVTWGAPTVSLTASPSTLYQGQSSTLTATASVLPAGDSIVVNDLGHYQTLSGANTATSGSSPFQTKAFSYTPGTATYAATIVNGAGQTVATSNTASVTWVALPTLTLTASSQTASIGTPVTLTASGSNFPSGYTVKIVDTTGDQTFGGHNTATGSTDPFAAQATDSHPQTVTYRAQLLNSAGTVMVTSNSVTVVWQKPPLSGGIVSGIYLDPGYPGSSKAPVNMWLSPDMDNPSILYSPSDYWLPYLQQHGWDGSENDQHISLGQAMGGSVNYQPDVNSAPQAGQATGTFTTASGKTYYLYGMGEKGGAPWGPTPWVWIRPESGFGFKFTWAGTVANPPVGGTVTWTMVNPDGASRTWSTNFQNTANGSAHWTSIDSWMGSNASPIEQSRTAIAEINASTWKANGGAASQTVSAYTSIPHYVFVGGGTTSNGSNIQPATWSLASTAQAAQAAGAKVNVEIQLQLKNGTVLATNVPDMATLWNLPPRFLIGISQDTFTLKVQKELANNGGQVGIFPGTFVGTQPPNTSSTGTISTAPTAPVMPAGITQFGTISISPSGSGMPSGSASNYGTLTTAP